MGQHITPPGGGDFSVGTSGAILSSDVLACRGCGVVFKAAKLIEKAPSARMIPGDLANVTCPVCLTTPG